MPALPRFPRISACVVALALLATASPSTAAHRTAAPGDTLTDRALALVSTVTSGAPLRVVITSVDHTGAPTFTTRRASSRAQAVELVRSALRSGQRVSMAQPVSIDASNDTYRSRQWALDALKAEKVWKITRGGKKKKTKKTVATKRVKVAVIDTGVATDHPDLKANLIAGRDVLDPGTSPYDENGHGTHVAGIIAAVASNKRGIAGLAPKVAVMPVRVLDRHGAGTTDDVARGVTWAADKGAKVINLSLSGNASDPALERAVAYAQGKGAVVVAAGGNAGTTMNCAVLILGCRVNTQYPAAYPGVVGVASVDVARARASYSSVGGWIDVAAPGQGIWSTTPKNNRLGCGTTTYCSISGTSMAAPYVAATAALARANPKWSAAKTIKALESTATDLGPAGRDTEFGFGLVNPLAVAKKAVNR